jgi:hypothetical protein
MMKQIRYALIFALLFSASVFSACEKFRTPENDIIQTVIDNAVSNDLFDDLSRQTALYESGITGNCPLVTISTPDTADYPKGIIINYEDGCIGPFNRNRSGRILINQSAPFTEKGMTREILLENYRVDNIEVQGYRNVTCTGKSNQGYPTYEVSDSLGILILPDEEEIRYKAKITREWTGGYSTPNELSDDVWKINGTGNGTNRLGFRYTFEIFEPMFYDMRCEWKMTKGKILIRSEGLSATADYGNGSCDNEIRVTTDEIEEIVYFY